MRLALLADIHSNHHASIEVKLVSMLTAAEKEQKQTKAKLDELIVNAAL